MSIIVDWNSKVSENIFYAGSPLAYSFDEANLEKSFLDITFFIAFSGVSPFSIRAFPSKSSASFSAWLTRFPKIRVRSSNPIGSVDLPLSGNNIYLDFPSVGATINIILSSLFASGKTLIKI